MAKKAETGPNSEKLVVVLGKQDIDGKKRTNDKLLVQVRVLKNSEQRVPRAQLCMLYSCVCVQL